MPRPGWTSRDIVALINETIEEHSLDSEGQHSEHMVDITEDTDQVIPLTDRIRPLIDGHFAIHDTIGMTPRTIQRILKRIANKARINRPVSPHVLRHTFAVAAVQKGISLPALQRLLGHDRLTTTEIYLNLSPEDVIREFREKW